MGCTASAVACTDLDVAPVTLPGFGHFGSKYRLGEQVAPGIHVLQRSEGAPLAAKVASVTRGCPLEKLQTEADLWLRACDHHNVLRIREVCLDPRGSVCYMITDCCYCSMQRWLTELWAQGGPSEELTRRALRDMMCSIDYVHYSGIVHRNLGPESFVLDAEDSRLRLSDFGLAVAIPKREGAKLHQVVDSRVPFRSPEMLVVSRWDESHVPSGYDTKTDIWSLGVTAYLMLFNELPYGSIVDSDVAMKRAIRSSRPAPRFAVSRAPSWARQDFNPCEDSSTQCGCLSISLVQKLLTRDQGERCTALQALNTPFLTDSFFQYAVDVGIDIGQSDASTDIVDGADSSSSLSDSDFGA